MQLPATPIQSPAQVFAEADADNSGSIDSSELAAVVAKCGVEATAAQLSAMHRDADADGSGGIDFVEFLNLMWALQSAPSERELRSEMFALLDDNLDGFVDPADLREAFARMAAATPGFSVPGDDLLRKLVAEAAADGRRVNVDDFAALLKTLEAAKAAAAGGGR